MWTYWQPVVLCFLHARSPYRFLPECVLLCSASALPFIMPLVALAAEPGLPNSLPLVCSLVCP